MEAEILGVYLVPNSDMKVARVRARAFVEKDLKCETRFSVVVIKKKDFEERYQKEIKQ
jgi:hypothetical protein